MPDLTVTIHAVASSPSSSALKTDDVTTAASGSGFVIVYQIYNGTQVFASWTESKGNSYIPLSDEQVGPQVNTRVYYCLSGVGGSGHNIQLNTTGAGPCSVYFIEIKTTNGAGVTLGNIAEALDVNGPNFNPGAATVNNGEAAIAFHLADDGGGVCTPSVDSSFSILNQVTDGDNLWPGASAVWIATSTGSVNPTWTSTGSVTNVHEYLMAFAEAPSTGISINVFDNVLAAHDAIFNIDLNLQPNVFDATTVTEFRAATTGIFLLAVSDSVTVTDVVFLTSGFLLLPQAADSTAVTDTATVLFTTLFISVNDATTVTDGGITFSFAQTTLAINVGDAVVMLDVVGGIQTFTGLFLTVSESVGVNRGYAKIDWNANTEPDLAGYRVYQGTTSGVYGPITYPYTGVVANFYDVGNVLTYTVLNLEFGTTYYFVITAYDTSNNESVPSAEVSKTPTDVLLGNVRILMNTLNVNDATTVTDAPAMDLLLFIITSDGNVIVSEGMALLRPFDAVSPFDSTAVTESISITFVTLGSVSVSVSEATTVTELVNVNFSGIIAGNDATTVTDAPQMNMLVFIPAMAAGQDTTGVTDAVTAQIVLSGVLSVSDSVTVADACTVRMDKILLTAFDSVLVSDGFNLAPRLVGPGGNQITGRLTNIAGTSQDTVLT